MDRVAIPVSVAGTHVSVLGGQEGGGDEKGEGTRLGRVAGVRGVRIYLCVCVCESGQRSP